MTDNDKVSITLSEKIERLIVKYHELETQNDTLREDVESLRAANSQKDELIAKLESDIKNKSLETDELLGKIEAVLGI